MLGDIMAFVTAVQIFSMNIVTYYKFVGIKPQYIIL